MHYGSPGTPPPHASFSPATDYRRAGHVEIALPLPRRGLTGWTIAVVAVGVVTLVLPWAVLGLATQSTRQLTHLLREGGGVLLVVAFLHTLLSVALSVLGVFVVRGRAIPGAFLLGGALFPSMVGAGGALYQQTRMLHAIASVSPWLSVRIGAEGFSEIDALVAFASLASAALSVLAAVALLGGVLSVDVRKLEADAQRTAGGAASAPNASWLVGSAVAVILAIVAFGSHLACGWSWQGGASPKLAVAVFLAAAVAAGPVLRVVRASAPSAPPSDPSTGMSTVAPHASLVKAEDVRRVAGGVVLGALAVVSAIHLFDRAAAALVSRGLLASFASGSAGDPLRGVLLPVLAVGVQASSRNLVIDVVLGAFVFAPALIVAVRRRPWAPMIAGLGLGLAFVVFSGGFVLARSARLSALAASADRMAALLPGDPCVVARPPPPPSEGTSYGWSNGSSHDLHRVVTAGGAIRDVDARSLYGSEALGILPDRGAPLPSLLEAAVPTASRSASEGTVGKSNLQHVTLLGYERPAEVPPGLEAYRSFLVPAFRGLDVDVNTSGRIPSALLETSPAPSTRTGPAAGAWAPTASKRRPAPFFALATTPRDVTLTCATNDLVLVRKVSLSDVPEARRAVEALRSECVVGRLFVVPSEGAKADDLYALLAVFDAAARRQAGITLPEIRPIVTLDRATATEWMAQNPEGPRPSPPIPSSLGFAADGSRKGTSSNARLSLRPGAVTVQGGLTSETVKRVVRGSFNRFRFCYENALVANPALAGTVSVRLAIDPQGKAVAAADAGTDITDRVMVDCVVRGFSTLVFPAPTGGGLVEVHYPLIFSTLATPP